MYKYNFHYLLWKLPYEDYQIAMKWIPERLNIAPSTWKSWIYAKRDSTLELTPSNLTLLASFFQCSIEKLINTQTKSSMWTEFKEYKNIGRRQLKMQFEEN